MKTIKPKFVCCVAILSLIFALPAMGQTASEKPVKRNVIIMIGDGMGFNTHVAGSYWRFGELGKQPVDSFPVQLAVSTYEIKEGVDFIPDDVKGYDPERFWKDLDGQNTGTALTSTTDSASAATAIYSGVKTLGGRMGMTQDKKPLKLLDDYAAGANFRTGVVSTVQLSHATPGAFASHNPSRGNTAEIFNEMLFQSNLTVLFGAGHPGFSNGNPILLRKEIGGKNWDYRSIGGEETFNKLHPLNQAETLVSGVLAFDAKADFDRLAENGFVLEKTSPFRIVGLARSLDSIPPVDGAPDDPDAEALLRRKLRNANFDDVPTLSTMSLGALNLLNDDASLGDSRGFLLMIEGGAIDWSNHGNDIELTVLEQTGFMKAIEAVIGWVEKNSSWDETLLIVTADHATGGLWGPETFSEVQDGDKTKRVFHGHKPLVNNGKGRIPGVRYTTSGHTNAIVPFWAKGVGADEFPKKIRGTDSKAGEFWGNVSQFGGKYIDNTDIAPVILNVTGFTNPLE